LAAADRYAYCWHPWAAKDLTILPLSGRIAPWQEAGGIPKPGINRTGMSDDRRTGEPRWVPIDAVVSLNAEEAAKTGEPHRLRDRVALTHALAHPWNVWVYFMDRDIAVLAARLYTSLATAQAFAAGNKRTAFRAASAFVEANGYALDLPPDPQHAIERLLFYFDGRLGQSGVVEWFRLWMTPRRPSAP
jgi:death-on-curing protein